MIDPDTIRHIDAAEAELAELPNGKPFLIGNVDSFKDHIEVAKTKLAMMPHAITALDTILSLADDMLAIGKHSKRTVKDGGKSTVLATQALAMIYVVRSPVRIVQSRPIFWPRILKKSSVMAG